MYVRVFLLQQRKEVGVIGEAVRNVVVLELGESPFLRLVQLLVRIVDEGRD